MLKNRNITVLKIFLIIFTVLVLRLFYLQVCTGQNLSRAAIAQRTTNLDIEEPRGEILDRNLIPFTNRSVKYSVVLKPLYFKENEEDLRKICAILELDFAQMRREMEIKKEPFFFEVEKDKRDLMSGMKMSGVSLINSLKRYNADSAARHVLGYLNKTDRTGEAGVEKYYEEALRYDKEDAVSVTTDARNNMVQGLGYRLLKLPGESGKLNVKLTLDYHIQKIVENVMRRNSITGAVVVEDVYTGDIVAMASMPDFDQNRIDRFLDSPGNELFNRAVASYNLGSIFKIIDAALFYELGQDPSEAYFCSGSIKIGELEFKCSSHDRGGHGYIKLDEAFALSCNPYFIYAGIRSGYRDVIEMAKRFGIGEETGIRSQGVDESKGNLPDPGKYHSDGDIANISIGQGEVMTTPLQVADMAATIANGGIRNRVNIVDSIVDAEGGKVREVRVKEGKRVVSKETAEKVKRLMEKVTISGTGTKASLEQYGGTAGKTGSAETGTKDLVHAWFAGYFPRRTPRYSMAVFIEGGMSGGDKAAPVFAEIAAEILKKGY